MNILNIINLIIKNPYLLLISVAFLMIVSAFTGYQLGEGAHRRQMEAADKKFWLNPGKINLPKSPPIPP